jgi:hypothetical protein
MRLRYRVFSLTIMSAMILGGCCPRYGCEWVSGTNWEGRHSLFVDNLNLVVGTSIRLNPCFANGSCLPRELDSGLVRYTIVDYPKWMKGCTYWYDVDSATNIVKAVGYRGEKQADGRESCWLPLQGRPKEITAAYK